MARREKRSEAEALARQEMESKPRTVSVVSVQRKDNGSASIQATSMVVLPQVNGVSVVGQPVEGMTHNLDDPLTNNESLLSGTDPLSPQEAALLDTFRRGGDKPPFHTMQEKAQRRLHSSIQGVVDQLIANPSFTPICKLSLDELRVIAKATERRTKGTRMKVLEDKEREEKDKKEKDGAIRGEWKNEGRRVIELLQPLNYVLDGSPLEAELQEALRESFAENEADRDWWATIEPPGPGHDPRAGPGLLNAQSVLDHFHNAVATKRHVAYKMRADQARAGNLARRVVREVSSINENATIELHAQLTGSLKYPLVAPKFLQALRALAKQLDVPLHRTVYVKTLLCLQCGTPTVTRFVAQQVTGDISFQNVAGGDIARGEVVFQEGSSFAVTVCPSCTMVKPAWQPKTEGLTVSSDHKSLEQGVKDSNEIAKVRAEGSKGKTAVTRCICSSCVKASSTGPSAPSAQVKKEDDKGGEGKDPAESAKRTKRASETEWTHLFTFGKP
jgi:hypothetical protein